MDYLYMRAWDYAIHGDNDYIRSYHIKNARAKNAPQDAIFYSIIEDRWVLFEEVTNKYMIKYVNSALKKHSKLHLSCDESL